MASGIDSGSDPASPDPFSRLKITRDAGFEAVQQAREQALVQAGEDLQERAKVEAAYDAVLMERLRERQSGRVSSAAASASQREQQLETVSSSEPRGRGLLLSRIRQLSLPTPAAAPQTWLPTLSLVEGQGLWVRLGLAGAGLVLVLLSPTSVELVLALGTIGMFLSQIRRGRRPLASVGWSVLFLTLGVLAGGLVAALLAGSAASLPLSVDQLQSLPALLVLALGALLLG
jgi:hypothetical protein